MPRAPAIDRTLTITEADVVILDLKKEKNYKRHIIVTAGYKTEIGLLRALRAKWTDPNTIPAHVINFNSYRRSFHMTEDEYINYIIKKEKEQAK